MEDRIDDGWRHTHTIRARGIAHKVFLDDGAFYTLREWEQFDSPDWELSDEGYLVFQGQIVDAQIERVSR